MNLKSLLDFKYVRYVITLFFACLALILAIGLWRYYMESGWTRDGKVRADVINIAPEVAGTVVKLNVHDNQYVHKGEVLFQVDPTRYQLALDQAKAELDQAKREYGKKQADENRRHGLAGVISAEEVDTSNRSTQIAQASVETAQAAYDLAELNLKRTTLRSPVNGYVTNLILRAGDYINVGERSISVIDADSYWIVGYFEETKMKNVLPGDKVRITLMGYSDPLEGHVQSINRGIADPNAIPDKQGLPQVNPVFTWVRLAQRIPVRIHIDSVPKSVPLVAGMTCSISVEGK